MSGDLLTQLQGAQAFDPAPRQDELHLYHVPFDELAGGSSVEASWALPSRTRNASRSWVSEARENPA
jgi:hypothetical protein